MKVQEVIYILYSRCNKIGFYLSRNQLIIMSYLSFIKPITIRKCLKSCKYCSFICHATLYVISNAEISLKLDIPFFITVYITDVSKLLSILVSPCDSDPCENGGKCSNIGDSFECKCTSEYSGKRCQNNGVYCILYIR